MSQPDRDIAAAAMIAQARARGLTWAQIGSAMIGRPDAKAAKAYAKKLARRANRASAALITEEAADV